MPIIGQASGPILNHQASNLDVDYAAIIEGPLMDYLHGVLSGYDHYQEELTVLFSENPDEMPPFSVTGYE